MTRVNKIVLFFCLLVQLHFSYINVLRRMEFQQKEGKLSTEANNPCCDF